MREKFWLGLVPSKSDFGGTITDEFIDGATHPRGTWGFMTPAEHSIHGRGVGQGKGQRYRKQEDGRWLKVEG